MSFIKYNNKLVTLNGKFLTIPGFDPYATALINRMTLAGETPTTQRQTAINTCIKSLRANGLFETQFDNLVVTRGYGINSTKMNWLGDFTNAIGVSSPTYTAGIGYNSDGSSSYLNTKYNPSIHGNLYKLNDASFLLKVSGSININNTGFHGGGDATALVDLCGYSTSFNRINNTGDPGIGSIKVGHNAITRFSSNDIRSYENSNVITGSTISTNVVTVELYIFRLNYPQPYYVTNTQIVEYYAMGKSISQSQFLIFQNIMDTYFNSI